MTVLLGLGIPTFRFPAELKPTKSAYPRSVRFYSTHRVADRSTRGPIMHLFVNALAASAGGGLTYLRNVIPYLSQNQDLRTTCLLSSDLRDQFDPSKNVSFQHADTPSTVLSRFWFEQRTVREFVRRSKADILLSTGNFAIFSSPVPQILLSRNSLYVSRDFHADLRARGDYRLWIDTDLKAMLAKWSICAADCTVAPSEAFASDLRHWTGRQIQAIHHGFDSAAFQADKSPLPPVVQEQLNLNADALKLLFVSHYNYYRNFETLFRALPLIEQRLNGRPVVLWITCKLSPGKNPGAYRTDYAAKLLRDLGVVNKVVQFGTVPYRLLHQLYRAADVYVSPAYAESFAHPLVESMSSGVPVVASDLPVHREVCGSSALYFDRFSAEQLQEKVIQVAQSPALAAQMSEVGRQRAGQFSWRRHVEELTALSESLLARRNGGDKDVSS